MCVLQASQNYFGMQCVTENCYIAEWSKSLMSRWFLWQGCILSLAEGLWAGSCLWEHMSCWRSGASLGLSWCQAQCVQQWRGGTHRHCPCPSLSYAWKSSHTLLWLGGRTLLLRTLQLMAFSLLLSLWFICIFPILMDFSASLSQDFVIENCVIKSSIFSLVTRNMRFLKDLVFSWFRS